MRGYSFIFLPLALLLAGITTVNAQTESKCDYSGAAIGPDAGMSYTAYLDFTSESTVTDVEVYVDISHTWSEDLEITLISPLGTSLVLQDDAGGAADNVLLTYSDHGIDHGTDVFTCACRMKPLGAGTFAVFDGEEASGTWSIYVNDDTDTDGGTFNVGCVYLYTLRDPDAEGCASPDAPFGSADSEISSAVTVEEDLIVYDVEVYADISHTFVGDVGVSLTSPDGSVAFLHSSNAFDGGDDIRLTWSDYGIALGSSPLTCDCLMQSDPAYSLSDSFYSTYSKGDWVLNVTDGFPAEDDGVLKSWCVRLYGAPVYYATPYSYPGVSFGAPGFPDGITDVVSFTSDDNEIVDDLAVSMSLTHTWTPDMSIAVESPAGTQVTLFDHAYSSSDAVAVAFVTFGHTVHNYSYNCGCYIAPSGPGSLTDFVDESQEGDWDLELSDNYLDGDAGYLYSWGLYFFTHADLYACKSPALGFGAPDDDANASVTDIINIAESGTVKDIEVSVEITHTFINDVAVSIAAPSGASVSLFNGGAPDNTIGGINMLWSDRGVDYLYYPVNYYRWQPMEPYGSLSALEGENINGDWALTCTDTYVPADGGTLNRWCLRFQFDDAPLFKRGDVNGNGSVQALSDTLHLLKYGFIGGDAPPCMVAADVNGNNTIQLLADALALLNWGFLAGPAPPAPGPTTCGPDPDGDELGCETPPSCL